MKNETPWKFRVAILGNFFATEPLGREIILNLIRHILVGHIREHDVSVKDILQTTVLSMMPVIDEGFDYIRTTIADDVNCGHLVANFSQVPSYFTRRVSVSNRFNNQGTIASDLKTWFHSHNDFDLIINIEAGYSSIL